MHIDSGQLGWEEFSCLSPCPFAAALQYLVSLIHPLKRLVVPPLSGPFMFGVVENESGSGVHQRLGETGRILRAVKGLLATEDKKNIRWGCFFPNIPCTWVQTLQYRKYATKLCNESALWFLCRCMICQSQYYSVFLSLPVDNCPHLPFQLVKALYMADALSWPNSVKTRHQLGTVGVPVAGSCQMIPPVGHASLFCFFAGSA